MNNVYLISEETLRQVLEVLESRLTKENRWTIEECEVMDSIRTILANPPKEPSAFVTLVGEFGHISWGSKRPDYPIRYDIPLYTKDDTP